MEKINVVRIHNLMKMSENIVGDYDQTLKLCKDRKIVHRLNVIEWIKRTLGKGHIDERDTTIQIFDKFLVLSYSENESLSKDNYFLYHAAAACILISFKLHDSKSPMNACKFSAQFNIEELLNFERGVLARTKCSISPLCTPTSFVHHIISISPIECDSKVLLYTVDDLISEFWEESESLLFAPSAIAISALLISFSILHLNCNNWLQTIPDICLPSESNPMFVSKENFLDIGKCIQAFEQIPSLRRHKKSVSPTSVADTMLDCEFGVIKDDI